MICPFCGHKLATLVFLIVCAYCKKAWTPIEFEIAVAALDRAASGEGK